MTHIVHLLVVQQIFSSASKKTPSETSKLLLKGVWMGALLWMGAAVLAAAVVLDVGGGKPIELLEARRICASLCLAGLGGRPCGDACASFAPDNFTAAADRQLPDSGGGGRVPARTRRDACPLLCQYQLGEPLCDCPDFFFPMDVDSYSVDFNRICAYFCIVHAYNVLGCRPCDGYNSRQYVRIRDLARRVRPTDMEIDWDEWCRKKCSVGDGGVACNCDLLPLPMSLMPANATL